MVQTANPVHRANRAATDERPATRFAFIHAAWHADIVGRARDSFVQEMVRHGVERSGIDLFEVAGAFEIPLLARRLARTQSYGAVVACALVVDGGIYRHDFVAAAVVNALMAVQLEVDIPVLSVVLTPHHFHAGDEHQQFFREHFVVKGAEAARACVQTVASLQSLESAAAR